MPAIIAKSISILSDAGLGMAMFSLGQSLSHTPLSLPKIFLYSLSVSYFTVQKTFIFSLIKKAKKNPSAHQDVN